jgi:4-amino-4-deoxy-L-arabinose transferase-like glycosyltransferase
MALVAAAVLVGLALRLYFYVGLIANDDLTHIFNAHRLFIGGGDYGGENVRLPGGLNARRLGVNVPLGLAMRIFGVHEWSLVLVPLVFSLAGIVIVAALLHVLVGRAAGVLAAWLWACLPADVYSATMVLQDSIFATVFAAGLLALAASERIGRWRGALALLAGAAFAYLVYVKEVACLLVVPLAIWGAWTLWRARGRDSRVLYLAGGLLAVHAAMAAYFWTQMHEPLGFWTRTWAAYTNFAHTMPASIPMSLRWLHGHLFKEWAFGRGILVFLVFLVGLLLDKRAPLRGLLLLLVTQAIVLVEAARGGSQARYLLQITVPFIVITVLGLHALLNRLRAPWPQRLAAPAAILLLLATAGSLRRSHQEWLEPGPGIRQAFKYLSACAAADDRIHMLGRSAAVTGNTFRVLAGFRQFKGGICNVRSPGDAATGWAVWTWSAYSEPADESWRTIPPNWLELFRAAGPRSEVVAHVFKILPQAPPPFVQVVTGGLTALSSEKKGSEKEEPASLPDSQAAGGAEAGGGRP